jgi:uroporphyrinogen decarboxylase
MNYRDLFREIMFYGSFHRMPVVHWGEWTETRERWFSEGLPRSADVLQFLGAVPPWISLIQGDSWLGTGSDEDDINIGLFPSFETATMEESEEYQVVRGADGVIRKEWKNQTSIPRYIDYSFRTAKDWDNYKRRLQPDSARIPPDIDQRLRRKALLELPICFPAGSLMGWLRNWMGLENMAYLMFDHRDVFRDVVMTVTDLTCWLIDRIAPKMQFDLAHSWEDICGRAGPLISPDIFRQCIAPGYRKIRHKLEEYGVRSYSVDSDGDISALAGEWLDAGVNILFPLEVGPFNGDARVYRRRYGRSLRLMGNFDKLSLQRGRGSVKEEIQRLLPLMKDGGYIITTDHHVTPGVALADYQWYLDQICSLRF